MMSRGSNCAMTSAAFSALSAYPPPTGTSSNISAVQRLLRAIIQLIAQITQMADMDIVHRDEVGGVAPMHRAALLVVPGAPHQ